MGILNLIRRPASDDEIIELYWNRDERAIDETDIKYRKYLFAIAYNILYSDEDCKECLNDTYMGTWEAIPPARPLNLKAFLTTIARRVAINRYNENRRQKRVPSNLTYSLEELGNTIGEDEILSEVESQRLGGVISAYLKTLSKRQRYIFMSRYYTADPIQKIADDLSISKSSVNKELAIIKNGLKEALEREGYEI